MSKRAVDDMIRDDQSLAARLKRRRQQMEAGNPRAARREMQGEDVQQRSGDGTSGRKEND